MPECSFCGIDPEIENWQKEDGVVFCVKGHAWHCVRIDGQRIAIGICCGHELGENLLDEEDKHE